MLLKCLGFGSGKYQRDTVAMLGQAPQELLGMGAIGRVAPDAAGPFTREPIVTDGELLVRRLPRLKLTGAWVHIELAERRDDFRWRQPIVGGRRNVATCFKTDVQNKRP